MTLATDIAGDHSVIDGTETVTVTPQNPTGTADSSVTALRRQLSRRELQFSGIIGLTPDDMVWHLWETTMSMSSVKAGDLITDSASVVFTILSASKDTLGTRWRCPCRKQI